MKEEGWPDFLSFEPAITSPMMADGGRAHDMIVAQEQTLTARGTTHQDGEEEEPPIATRTDASTEQDSQRTTSMSPSSVMSSGTSAKKNTTSFESAGHGGGGGLMRRTKSLFSMASSASSTSSESSYTAEQQTGSVIDIHFPQQFGLDVRQHTRGMMDTPLFDMSLRSVMEPHLRKARLAREMARTTSNNQHSIHNRSHHSGSALDDVHSSIASSVGVPYTALRNERRFLFDEHSYPLHSILAKTLQVDDLAMIHEQTNTDDILAPLANRERRQTFHAAYDSFVTSFCIPLLHSMAMSANLFHSSLTLADDSVTYRYQAFPSLRIVRPGERYFAGPTCDTALGYSIGCLNFHIPLTPSFGTNSTFVESHPGREDWHPLDAKSVGLGYLFDGARCIHFDLENTTTRTAVSLDFRVILYREGRFGGGGHGLPSSLDDDVLCSPRILEDKFSSTGPGYYDEAVVDLRRQCWPGCPGGFGMDIVTKKNSRRSPRQSEFLDPDERNGPPFL